MCHNRTILQGKGQDKGEFKVNFKNEISSILSRKVISASISGSIFAILLGLFMPDPFGVGISAIGEYVQKLIIAIPTYLMYSFPVILLYGTITSIISDYIARLISHYTNKKGLKIYLALTLHMLFGLILLWYSLVASILFFITDYILMKKHIYKWNNALKSLAIPILVWIIFLGYVHMMDLFR